MPNAGTRQSILTWSYVCLSIAAFSWILFTGTDFSNDDLDFFAYLQQGNLFQLMITPLNEHWVPFHRLSSWLVYQPGAMRYEVAVGMLLAFHLVAVVYLRAALRKLGAGMAADVLACAYASCVFLLYGMIGFANAQLRVPHIALCAMAIYHYVAWLEGGGRRHVWLAAIAFFLDLCVYQKAVLVPVYMGLVGWIAFPQRFRVAPVKAALLPACLLLVSIAVVAFYKLKIPSNFAVGIPTILSFEWRMSGLLLAGILGVTAETLTPQFSIDMGLLWTAIGIWVAAITVSIGTVRGAWKAWAALLFVVALDFLPLLSSNRMFMGEAVLYSYRYYYESIFLVFLMLGLVCAQHARSPGFRVAAVKARVLAVATLAIYSVIQLASLHQARKHSYDYVLGAQVRQYMKPLRAGLAKIEDERPVFKDSQVPGHMFLMNEPDVSSRIVTLLVPQARFETDPEHYYYVMGTGEVVRRTRPRRQ